MLAKCKFMMSLSNTLLGTAPETFQTREILQITFISQHFCRVIYQTSCNYNVYLTFSKLNKLKLLVLSNLFAFNYVWKRSKRLLNLFSLEMWIRLEWWKLFSQSSLLFVKFSQLQSFHLKCIQSIEFHEFCLIYVKIIDS